MLLLRVAKSRDRRRAALYFNFTIMMKNHTRYEYTTIQSYALKWLKVFSGICLINSCFLFFLHGPEYPKYFEFSMLLPFAHCGIIWILFLFNGIYYWINFDNNVEAQYIKKNYPKIWSNLHPWGDFSYNSFASFQFIRGKYDDGKDEKLNKIKFSQKTNSKIILWAFFLVPIIWFLNVTMMLISEIIKKV